MILTVRSISLSSRMTPGAVFSQQFLASQGQSPLQVLEIGKKATVKVRRNTALPLKWAYRSEGQKSLEIPAVARNRKKNYCENTKKHGSSLKMDLQTVRRLEELRAPRRYQKQGKGFCETQLLGLTNILQTKMTILYMRRMCTEKILYLNQRRRKLHY